MGGHLIAEHTLHVNLEALSRVVSGDPERLSRHAVEGQDTIELSKSKQWTVTFLILLCNLFQFTSMFSTVAGGFEFSKKVGHEAGPGDANWMGAAYSLTQSAFVLISGRLGAIYGHQRLVLIGCMTIVVFSIVNAFCNTYTSFIIARALTGIGGGILMPNAVATLTILVPPGKARNLTLAAFAASPPIGAWVGAMLAGVFLKYTAWKWHFITIACLEAIATGGLILALPREDPADKEGGIDFIGILLGLGGLILFNIAWNQAPASRWQTPYIIAILVVSVVLIAMFFVWESKFAKEPIMPLAIFNTPSFRALIFVVLFIYMSVGITLWEMVAWQQFIRHWTVMHIAIGWIPYGVGASFAVFAAAWLIPRLDAQYILALGCLTSIGATILLATMPAQQIYWAQVFPATVLGSLCPDFVYVAAQVIASNSVGKREQGVASSLIGTLNLYGNSLGLGFAGTIEAQIVKRTGSQVTSYRSALWFGAALSVIALILDLVWLRMPKDDREGWKSTQEFEENVSEMRASPPTIERRVEGVSES